MEVVGVVLGAVALLIPAAQGYQKCATLLETYRGHAKELKKFQERLSVQKKVFDRECLIILSTIVDQDLAIDMLASWSHTRWSDKDLNDLWEKKLGHCFNIPLKIIHETLNEIEQQFNTNPSPPQIFQSIRLKLEWTLSKKQKLQGLLNILRKQNQDLRCLREQGASLQKPRGTTQGKSNGVVGLGTPRFAIRDAANRLYRGLAATAVCPCHRVNLRLQQLERPFQGSTITQTISFRFVVTTNTETQDTSPEPHQCTCLTADSELHVIDIAARSLPEIGGIDGGINLIVNTKRVQQHDIARWSTSGTAPAVDDTATSTYKTSTNKPTESTPGIVTIEDLCSRLQSLQLISGSQTEECLGIIESTASTADYRHLIYRDPDPYPMAYRVSLSNLFKSRGNQGHFSRDLRLKTAFVLSYSLLYFGSSQDSWFQDRWRAKDIFFFLDHQNYTTVLDSTLIPYIETIFPRPSKGKGPAIMSASSYMAVSKMPSAGLSRNEKLFSLALVLIEIAFGNSIFKLMEPSGLSDGTQNEFVEYIKVKGIIDSHMLVGEMGSGYAAVVKRCFYCDFGIGEEDLEKEEVQSVFYERVVLELERCLKTFRGE